MWSPGHKARGQRHKKKSETKAKNRPFREQTLSRPRTRMLEAKDQGHRRRCSPKKMKGLQKTFFRRSPKKKFSKNFSGALQNFNNSKNRVSSSQGQGNF